MTATTPIQLSPSELAKNNSSIHQKKVPHLLTASQNTLQRHQQLTRKTIFNVEFPQNKTEEYLTPFETG
jgi:hypothetical protein